MPPTARRNLAGAALLALFFPLALARAAHAAPTGPAPLRPLDERTLGIGESHNYFFPMKAGEYLRIDVEQNDDIDAGIRLYDSQGKLLFHGNSYTGTHGAETMSWIADKAEVLRVEVYAWEELAGRYTASFDGPRAPTLDDEIRTRALRALFEGVRLQELQPRPLIWLAEQSYRVSAQHWAKISEERWSVITKRHIAHSLYIQGEKRAARSLYAEVLPSAMKLDEPEMVVESSVFLLDGVDDLRHPERYDTYAVLCLEYLPRLVARSVAFQGSYLADSATSTGRLQLAAEFHRLQIEGLTETGQIEALGVAYRDLGRVLRRLGRLNEALRAAENQGTIAEDYEQKAAAELAKGAVYLANGQIDLALSDFLRADSFGVGGELGADIAYSLGWASFENGDKSGALAHFKRAAALRPPGREIAVDWAFAALCEIQLGAIQHASVSLSKARSLWKSRDAGAAAFLERVTAEYLYAISRQPEALHHLDLAFAKLEEQRRDSTSEVLRVSFWSMKSHYLDFAIKLLMDIERTSPSSGFARRAFDLVDSHRALALADRLRGSTAQVSGIVPLRNGLERDLETLDDELRALRSQRPPNWRDREAELQRDRIDLVLRGTLSAASKRLTQRQRSAPEVLPPPRNALLEGEVLVSYFLGQEGSYAWIVHRDRVESISLPPRRDIEMAATTVVSALISSRSPGGTERARLEAAKLASLVWLPVRQSTGPGRILLSPDGNLHEVPFAALEWSLDESAVGPHAFVFSLVPSLRTLGLLRTGKTRDCSGSALVIAESDSESFLEDQSALANFDHEAKILRTTRSSLLQGAINSLCTVHVAAHGTSDESWPDTAALILPRPKHTDRLYAFEIRDLQLSADLVVLAACDTAAGEVRGEGHYGLTAAFQAAGARQVVATLWPVDSTASRELTALFYSFLRQGGDPSRALNQARLALQESPDRAAPAFWAAYQIYGVPEAVN